MTVTNPAMVPDLVASAQYAMQVLKNYPHTHGDTARAVLRERLTDLALLGERTLVRNMMSELKALGIRA